MLSIAVTAGLLVAAFLTDAASRPWLWRAVFAVWAVWMALDGWRLARRHPDARTAPRRRPALVAAATVLAVAAAYVGYGLVANSAFASGEAAQARGDCGTATSRYDLVTGPFELTLSEKIAAAERNRQYCAQFQVAVDRHQRGEFEAAITGFEEFLADTPANSLDGPARDRIQRAYLEWAKSARAAGDHPVAIAAYRELLEDYRTGWSVEQARSELAQTLVDEAQMVRSKFNPDGGVAAVVDVRRAMQNYLLVQKDFADTEAAAGVPKAIVDAFNEAIRPFTSGKHCEALPTLEYLVTMPADRSAGVVATAKQHHATASFECGVSRYRANAFDEALDHFETVTTQYRDHPVAAAAGSGYVAASIAIAKPGTVPPLPPPLGSNTPGSIRLTFFNDTSLPTEVLVVGPTAHRFVIAGCTSCPESYENEADACASSAGKPTFELRLRPGEYHFLNRDVDEAGTASDVATITLRGAETYCLYRGPIP